MSNAIKFTEKGSIEIILEENANDVTIKVIDQGIGIAKEKLDYVFERFKQADGSTTRKYGGTGLGMSIVKKIIDIHKGSIKIESIENVGTTVTISFF